MSGHGFHVHGPRDDDDDEVEHVAHHAGDRVLGIMGYLHP